MQLHGLHHMTAVTSTAKANVTFYTQVLGLRLVKKTVNQDDVSAYHLYYADKVGSPGTDMTFFDWAQIGPNSRGTDSIIGAQFRVNGHAALEFWLGRLDEKGVQHGPIETFAGREIIRLEDPEGQRIVLVDDGGASFHGEIWEREDIPTEYAIRGFFAVSLSVPSLKRVEPLLTQLLGFEKTAEYPSLDNPAETVYVFSMDGGGPNKEVHIVEQPNTLIARLGAGGVHHVAFRVSDDGEQGSWNRTLTSNGVRTSGVIDRFYFKSVYFRISPGILFELATDGPGFATDEPLETMGETLALPPFLEPHRVQIEAGLLPL